MSNYARELTYEQEDHLSIWRTLAVKRMRPLRRLAYATRYICSPGMPGIGRADDRLRVYFDPDAWVESEWSDEDCAEALLMLLHQSLLGHHAAAKKKRSEDGVMYPDLWSLASEAAANSVLIDGGITFPSTVTMTAEGLGAPKGLHVADYYDDLLSRYREAGIDLMDVDRFNSDDAADYTMLMSGLVTDGFLPDGTPYNESFIERGVDDLDMLAPPAPDFEVVSTIEHVAEEIVKSGGEGAGHLTRWASEVTKPTLIPWQTVLSAHMRTAVRTTSGGTASSYSVRNRRRPFLRIGGRKGILPGRTRPLPQILVIRDTSASVTDTELSEMVTAISEIAESAGVRKGDLLVMDADDGFYESVEYTGHESIQSASGGGGTDMRVALAAAEDAFRRPPTLVVVCTDGGTPWPETPTRFPVVAVITSHGVDSTPEWITAYSTNGVPA